MELTEVTDMLYRMKEMVQLAMKRLEEGVEQTQSNVGKVYWLNVKIHNNSQKFTNDEINKAIGLEAELRRVSACYKNMTGIANEISHEIDTYIDKAKELEQRGDADWEAKLCETMKLGQLNEKIQGCLKESQRCLDMQDELLQEEKEFDDSLRDRLGSNKKRVWFVKLKSLFKGVHI
jgi:vacuolar-type H+-ATPase subunit I/STV1